mmetsp:Transcript_2645/g.4567  ORF Transcript_2645/g.4567 Transcript_2645/m.4567 type:complete len:216 (-) Transcript_2645:152-799(-)
MIRDRAICAHAQPTSSSEKRQRPAAPHQLQDGKSNSLAEGGLLKRCARIEVLGHRWVGHCLLDQRCELGELAARLVVVERQLRLLQRAHERHVALAHRHAREVSGCGELEPVEEAAVGYLVLDYAVPLVEELGYRVLLHLRLEQEASRPRVDVLLDCAHHAVDATLLRSEARVLGRDRREVRLDRQALSHLEIAVLQAWKARRAEIILLVLALHH